MRLGPTEAALRFEQSLPPSLLSTHSSFGAELLENGGPQSAALHDVCGEEVAGLERLPEVLRLLNGFVDLCLMLRDQGPPAGEEKNFVCYMYIGGKDRRSRRKSRKDAIHMHMYFTLKMSIGRSEKYMALLAFFQPTSAQTYSP